MIRIWSANIKMMRQILFVGSIAGMKLWSRRKLCTGKESIPVFSLIHFKARFAENSRDCMLIMLSIKPCPRFKGR